MIKGFKEPTQEELDRFYSEAKQDESIAPYLSNVMWHHHHKVYESDWFGLMYISNCGKCFINIGMQRNMGLEFDVAVFSKSTYLAGKALLILQKAIRMYNPYYVNSTVKASNKKSLKTTRLLFGKEWGVEKNVCYSFVKGDREDLYYFRQEGTTLANRISSRKFTFA